MKITILLFFSGLISVIAGPAYSQNTKISLDMKDATVESILNQIEEVSEFYFLFNHKLIDVDRKINIAADKEPIKDILSEIFKNDVRYIVSDRQIVLTPAKTSPKLEVLLQQQVVNGKITDASTGDPMPGVNIIIKGTSTGVISDQEGKFSLSVPGRNTVLVLSFIGYITQEIQLDGKTDLNIALASETVGLEEVIVVGYGTQRKVNLTGAVSQVGSDVLDSKAIINVGQGLQGIIPNLNVTISNGSPNTIPTFNVRGGTSFSGNSFIQGSPLILVDGYELSNFNLLNPEDIESISVLKDASSAAIYGARAAYGVMLITTKKGRRTDRIDVSYNASIQLSRPVAVPDLLDSYTAQLALNNSKLLTGQTVSTDEENKLQWMKDYIDNPETAPVYKSIGNAITWVGNTDVYGEAIRDWTPAHKHSINLSGGSEKTNYYASISYHKQEGLYNMSPDILNRYNLLLNLSTDVTDWFNVSYKASYNKSTYSEPYNNPGKGGWWYAMGQGLSYNINMPLKTPKDSPVGEMFTDNILNYMAYGSENKLINETTLLSVASTIKIAKGLNLKGDFTYDSYNYNQKLSVPELVNIALTWTPVISPHTNPSWISRENAHQDKFALNLYGDFTRTFAERHNIYALIGFNQEWMKYNNLWSKGLNMLTSSLPVISQTLGTKTTGDSESEWAIRGAFFRLNYNYSERYLFELNGRYDGTSKFPTDSRYKLFPSVSAGWRISEELFFQNIKNTVNNLKIRASYGSLGNQNVSNYIYFPSYGTISKVGYIFNGIRPMGVTAPGLVSPDLTWETATTIDFGFDISLIHKLDFTFDWYNRTTTDILVAGDKFPAVLGTSAPTKNSGAMKSVGWEITSSWRDRFQNGFQYNITLVLSDYQSEITQFDGNPAKLLSSLYVGQKMGEIWGYETMGLFQSAEEITGAPSQKKLNSGVWYPGDVRYKNLDDDESEIYIGSNTAEDPGDRRIIGNNTPRYQFGIDMNASWKNLDLNLFLQGVGKRDFWTNDKFYWGQILLDGVGTWYGYENSWTPQNKDAFFPGYRYFTGNTQVQTRYLQNAAYIRFKNLTLGYTIPANITRKVTIEKARVYITGQNIWEATKIIKTLDPETVNGNYPIMRSYAFGIQVSF